jgi:hypothetical protein
MVPQKVDLMVHPKVLSTGLRTAATKVHALVPPSAAQTAVRMVAQWEVTLTYDAPDSLVA